MLTFPMRWRWTCSNGHVASIGVDVAADNDRAVEAIFEDGKIVAVREL